MATDLERLVVQLSADIKGYERALTKAYGQTDSAAKRIERRFATMQASVAKFMSALGTIGGKVGGLAAVTIGGAGVSGVVNLTDGYRALVNQLKVTGLAGDGLSRVYDALAASAQRNYAPLSSLVTLYSRASQAAKELGASEADLLKFSDNVAQALRVAGTTPAQASGALLQLGQLLGSARVQAEEFNSVNEGARPILQAVADGLEEAGGSVSKLKQLVNDGEVSNRAFFEAFRVGAEKLEGQLANASVTVSGALENLKTTILTLAGRMDEGSQTTESVVTAIGDLQRAVVELADFVEGSMPRLKAFGDWLLKVRDNINGAAEAFGRFTGLRHIGGRINDLLGTADSTQMSDQIDTAGSSVAALEAKAKRLSEEIGRLSTNRLTLDTSRIKEAREELEKARASIAALVSASERASSRDVTQAIVGATPVGDLPPPVIAPSPASTPLMPISVKTYPVAAAKSDATDPKLKGLRDGFAASLQGLIAAAKAAGHDISILSGKRTTERQAQLFADAVRKYGSVAAARKHVAPPGRSQHEVGQAADLSFSGSRISGSSPSAASAAARRWAHENAGAFGLTFPMDHEPWHVEPEGARRGRATATPEQRQADKVANVIADLTRERDEIGKTAEQRRLLQELQQAGVDLNSKEGASITALIAQIHAQRDAQEAAAQSAEDLQRAREEFAEMGADAAKGFVADLRAGKSAADALKSALDRIVTRLTDGLIDSLFKTLFQVPSGGGGGGVLGAIGSLFGGFKESGGAVQAGKAYVVGEKRPEIFMPGRSGTIVPRIPSNLLSPKMPAARHAPRGGGTLNVRTSIDLTGANGDETIRRLAREQAEIGVARGISAYDRNFRNRVEYMNQHEA